MLALDVVVYVVSAAESVAVDVVAVLQQRVLWMLCCFMPNAGRCNALLCRVALINSVQGR